MSLLKLDYKLAAISIAIATFVSIFLATRLINLTAFPLFVDEGRHIVAAQLTASGDIFNGLKFGLKQLYIWIVAIPFGFFGNPILVARLVSVLSGLLSAGICYRIAGLLYPGRQLGYIAALFYLISPFALFFDRLALTDGLLTMLVGLNILGSYQMWTQPTIKRSLLLGIIFGLIALTKAYAVFYSIMPLLFWLILGRISKDGLTSQMAQGGTIGDARPKNNDPLSWFRIATLMIPAYIIPVLTLTLIFFIGQDAYETEYAAKFSPEIILASAGSGFLEIYGNNMLLAANWLSTYLTLPFAGLLILSLILIVIRRDKIGVLLGVVLLLPFLFLPVVFTVWYSRYLMPSIVPISILVALGIDHLTDFIRCIIAKVKVDLFRSSLSKFLLQGGTLLLLAIPSIPFNYWLIAEPLQAPLPASDRWDYIESRFSGYGLKESAQIVAEIAGRYPELIILRGTNVIDTISSLDVIGMVLYLPNPEKISYELLGDLDTTTIQRLDTFAKRAPTLTLRTFDINDETDTVWSQIFEHPQAWQLATFPKPGQHVILELYQWILPPEFAIRWFQQAGDPEPRVAWSPSDALITASGGELLDWSQFSAQTSETMQESLTAAGIEYIFATPDLIAAQPDKFAPFITTDGTRLQLRQLPPGWRLAYLYPDINCTWCLFQLKPPAHTTEISFGGTIELEGYDISARQLSPGEALYVTLYWNSMATLPESAVVFIHLIDAGGNLVGQIDAVPLQGRWPTDKWRAGDKFADRHTLRLATSLPAGDYKLMAGMYSAVSLERISVLSEQSKVVDNAVELTAISIK